MSTFSQTPGELNVETVLGTDFLMSLNFSTTISALTFEAGIILTESPSQTVFPITVAISGTNIVNLSLTDTQINAIGLISGKKWYLTKTVNGIKQMILSGDFQISNTPIGQNNGIQYVLINDLTVSSQYAVGATGATGVVSSTPSFTTISVSGEAAFGIPVQTKSSPSISANALSLNLAAATLFSVTLNQNVTVTFSSPPASPKVFSFILQFIANGTGYTTTWPASVKWPSSTPPTITTTNGKIDTFTFITHDGGTNWFGIVNGQNY